MCIQYTDLSLLLTLKKKKGRNCSAAEFRCGDGRCINVGWVCDGTADCDDGLDEKSCPKPTCHKMDEFMCGNGRCVPVAWRCDGDADCIDSSDEKVRYPVFLDFRVMSSTLYHINDQGLKGIQIFFVPFFLPY